MTFVPIDKLVVGMMLDRDVYLYDCKTSKIVMLKSGQILTQAYINRLGEMGLLGAYIHSFDKKEFFDSKSPISPELKLKAISSETCI